MEVMMPFQNQPEKLNWATQILHFLTKSRIFIMFIIVSHREVCELCLSFYSEATTPADLALYYPNIISEEKKLDNFYKLFENPYNMNCIYLFKKETTIKYFWCNFYSFPYFLWLVIITSRVALELTIVVSFIHSFISLLHKIVKLYHHGKWLLMCFSFVRKTLS